MTNEYLKGDMKENRMRKKEEIIAEFAQAVFIIASILCAFFAGVLLENTAISLILLFIATLCGVITISYNDEEVIKE